MVYFVCIFGYLLVLMGIGIYKSRQVKNQDDFALAGRSLSPWIMVCTMLAVWIGTGSIVGNAEKTYDSGLATLILPIGTFIGLILLAFIASKARDIKASSVPEIIGMRFGQVARTLAVISLIVAYMVIVSYQFNAGGAVLEVITGDKDPVAVNAGDTFTRKQLTKGRLAFTPAKDWQGDVVITFDCRDDAGNECKDEHEKLTPPLTMTLRVVADDRIVEAKKSALEKPQEQALKMNKLAKIVPGDEAIPKKAAQFILTRLPENGTLELVLPKLTAQTATLIAAIFIVIYTVLAGLMSLAYADIVTGCVITLTMLITFPIYWFQAGGWDAMLTNFTVMGKASHMDLWTVYTPIQLINFCLPVFLLVLGDANQYQRIFASRNAKGARSAVITMIFVAYIIELLIIACAWLASSMTPDAEQGKYILIYAAKLYLPLPLACLFMVTVVGIIISTADSFLLVPATTFIKDVYLNFINPKAGEKKILFISRVMVVIFGVIAYFVSRAFSENTGFFEKALYAFTIYGASITPSIVAAILWKRATKAGSIASILSGMTVALLWSELIAGNKDISGWLPKLDAVLPAILISVFLLVVVSLLTKPTPDAPKEEAA